MLNNTETGFSKLIISVIVVLLVLLGAGIYFMATVTQISEEELKQSITDESAQPLMDDTTISVSDWNTHRNDKLRFQFKYPPNFAIGKYKEEVISLDESTKQKLQLLNLESYELEKFEKRFVNTTVLIEKKFIVDISVLEIPVGEMPTIGIERISRDLAEQAIDLVRSTEENIVQLQIGNYTVKKFQFPFYPGLYGEKVFYYLLTLSDDFIIAFTAPKNYSNQLSTNYDIVIENIISTFRLTN